MHAVRPGVVCMSFLVPQLLCLCGGVCVWGGGGSGCLVVLCVPGPSGAPRAAGRVRAVAWSSWVPCGGGGGRPGPWLGVIASDRRMGCGVVVCVGGGGVWCGSLSSVCVVSRGPFPHGIIPLGGSLSLPARYPHRPLTLVCLCSAHGGR
jgi:hypothetical protein